MSGDHKYIAPAAGAGAAHTLANVLRERMARSARGERGATMVEYGLLLALVLIVAFLTVKVFGESAVALFDGAGTIMKDNSEPR